MTKKHDVDWVRAHPIEAATIIDMQRDEIDRLRARPTVWYGSEEADACERCGYPRNEHSYNGACYGLCGEFVPRNRVNRGTAQNSLSGEREGGA